MTQQLRRGDSAVKSTYCAYKGPSLVPSNHIRQLTITCDFSSRASNTPSIYSGHLHSHVHIPMCVHPHTCIALLDPVQYQQMLCSCLSMSLHRSHSSCFQPYCMPLSSFFSRPVRALAKLLALKRPLGFTCESEIAGTREDQGCI